MYRTLINIFCASIVSKGDNGSLVCNNGFSLGNGEGLFVYAFVGLKLHALGVHKNHDDTACVTGVVVLVNCNSRSRIKTGVLGRSDCDDCVIGKLSELVEDGCHGFDSIDVNSESIKERLDKWTNEGNILSLVYSVNNTVYNVLELTNSDTLGKLLFKSFVEMRKKGRVLFVYPSLEVTYAFDDSLLIFGQYEVYGRIKVGIDTGKYHVNIKFRIIGIKSYAERF